MNNNTILFEDLILNVSTFKLEKKTTKKTQKLNHTNKTLLTKGAVFIFRKNYSLHFTYAMYEWKLYNPAVSEIFQHSKQNDNESKHVPS